MPRSFRFSRQLAIGFLAILMIATPASGAVLIENFMAADYGVGDEGLRVYDYGSGTQQLFDTDADFNSGTTSGDITAVGDELVVNSDWWSDDWSRRQCFTVASDTPYGQYPFRIVADTSAAATDDIRIVEALNPANSATPVPHYVESGVGTNNTIIWFQGEALVAGKEYCAYFANTAGATTTSDQFTPFTYTNGQTIDYYAMYPAYNGTTNVDGELTVLSYVDGNVVSDDDETATINAGATYTFTNVDRDSVISATGPIEGTADRNEKDTVVPEAYAESSFVFATTRGTQRFYVRSPFGATSIQPYDNGVAVGAPIAIAPVDGVVEIAVDGGTQPIVLESTDGTDFLAVHVNTGAQDTFSAVPWFGDSIFGVGSENLLLSAITSAPVDIFAADGFTQSTTVSNAALYFRATGPGRGDGTAYRVDSSAGQIAAIQQRDDNGVESTSFLPERLLSQTYRIPTQHHYWTISCPVVGTQITVNGGPAQNCAGTNVGHLYSGLSTFPAGTLLEGDAPFFVYYESAANDDESNVVGVKGAIPYSENVTISPDVVEVLGPFCGIWTSPIFPVSDVLGLVFIDSSLVAGGSHEYQIAFDGGTFVGPDGTAGTNFTNGDYIDYTADGSTSAQLRVELCGSGSAIDSLGLEDQLDEVFNGDSIAVNGDEAALRVYPTLNDSFVSYISSTAPDTYNVDTDVAGGSPQIVATTGTVTNPAPVFTSQPYTISFSNVSTQTSTLEASIIDEAGVRSENQVTFAISS